MSFLIKRVALVFVLPFLIGGGVSHAETVKDDTGKTVRIPEAPLRIVSLSPGITEILFALGLNEEIVGVTTYCNYPEDALRKEKIGGFTNPNMEKIVFLRPNLVIATVDGNSREVVKRLEGLSIPVLATKPFGLRGVLSSITSIGRATRREGKASEVVGMMQKRIDALQKKIGGLKRPKVFYQLWDSPLTAAGKGTFIDDMIVNAGGENIVREGGYPIYSMEQVLLVKPDVIIVSAMADEPYVEKWKGWDIPAVKNRRLFSINPDITNRPSPRLIEGLERMAEMFHPEVSGDRNGFDKK